MLWPEHFDLGITLDRVNYGSAPGDADIGVPYAYVGPWTTSHPDRLVLERVVRGRPTTERG